MSKTQNQIYALLVGINDYPSSVGKLQGCINDIDYFHDWLTNTFVPGKLKLEILKDSDATRGNIIHLFRTHLSQASRDDIVLFQYSGHGARSKSSEAFRQFYPDGKDEGLVCYDSREPGGFDLADKELAVLLAELAPNEPHIAVLLDCCHSGSGTRGADDFTQARARVTHEIFDERPLETYLDGHYAARMARGEPLEIPVSRHILFAACERVQKAWESKDHRGVFSNTLLDVLDQSGGDITYADLFLRARAAVRRYADNQTPQFETYQRFDAYSGFLGGGAPRIGRRYSVYFDVGSWKVDCGALHGLPSDPDKAVELALYPESNQSVLVGHAETIQVGPQKSELRLLDLDADPAARFQAKVTTLPVPPLLVKLEGNDAGVKVMHDCMTASDDQSPGFAFSSDSDHGLRYVLASQNDLFSLRERETGRLIQGAAGYTEAAAEHIFSNLKRIAAWERAVALQNQATRMEKESVDFRFVEVIEDDKEYAYPGDEITVDITKEGNAWREITAKLRANNRTSQPLHFALAYLSDDFGIQVPYNERIEPTDRPFDLMIAGRGTFLIKLEDHEGDEATHIFKLIVSTERIDDFLLTQDALEIGKIFRVIRGEEMGARGGTFGESGKKLIHQNEWFTKTIRVRLVRQLAQISQQDTSLASGGITVKGHSSLKADISLSSAQTGSRGAGTGSDFYRALERQGMVLLNFSGTRGEAEGVLELSDIQNPEAVRDQPLEIELNLKLSEDEYILPLTFDGEHILLAGEPEKGAGGRTLIHIDCIPDSIPDQRRSLGKALKLYFFKTYLKRPDVNKLCWVEYKTDGSVERHAECLAEKVAAASNILLLIHGIIGDTEVIAKGVRLAKDENRTSVDAKFDLVVTYDYENLSTSIQDTARQLKKQLNDIGLHALDDKRLTLLVHSMGGLVARWFIEQEGGNQVVDHLVMCGTPNVGSPFGKIDSARNLTSVLTTWAVNSFPVFAPFGAGLLTVLGRSKKISPCLEQMNPASPFIQELNAGSDPGVRYSILAGDIRNYQEESDPLLAKLTAKIGKGALFGALFQERVHDIAVSLASIQGVPNARHPVPVKREIGCHHLNYFISEAGLRALTAVEW